MNTFIPKTSFCTWEKANLLHLSGMVSTAHFRQPDWFPPKVRGQPQLRQEEFGKLIALSQTKIQIKQVTSPFKLAYGCKVKFIARAPRIITDYSPVGD